MAVSPPGKPTLHCQFGKVMFDSNPIITFLGFESEE